MMRRLKGILSGKTEFQIKSAVSRNQQAQPKSGGYRRVKNKQYSKHLGAKVHRTHRRFLISVKPAVEPAKLIRKGRHSYCSALNETRSRSEEHTSELQSRGHLVCRLLLEKKN